VLLEIRTAGTRWRNVILVKVTTNIGLAGWGEATIEYRDRALLAYLPEVFERAVRGRDPLQVEEVMSAMVRADYWRSGFIARTAFSAIEMACWDIIGRHAGRPVYKLLSPLRTEPLIAYPALQSVESARENHIR
jgi:L-alanine-DL-glutamate epimerase-like enolase superfamily enzyme